MLVSQLPQKPFQNPTGLPADQSKHLEGILPLNNSYKITHSQSHLHLPPLTLLLTLPPWHPNDRLCENKGKKRATVPVMAWKLVWPAGLCLNMSSPQHCLTSVSNRTHTCVFSDEGKNVLTLCYCVSCSSVITGRKHETSGHLVVPEWCHQVKKAGLLLRIHKEKTVLIIMHSYHASQVMYLEQLLACVDVLLHQCESDCSSGSLQLLQVLIAVQSFSTEPQLSEKVRKHPHHEVTDPDPSFLQLSSIFCSEITQFSPSLVVFPL